MVFIRLKLNILFFFVLFVFFFIFLFILVDINECKDGLHDCGDVSNCENTHGSFNCICKIDTKYKGK